MAKVNVQQFKEACKERGLVFKEVRQDGISPYADGEAYVGKPNNLPQYMGGENPISRTDARFDIKKVTTVWWDAGYDGRGRDIVVYQIVVKPEGEYIQVEECMTSGNAVEDIIRLGEAGRGNSGLVFIKEKKMVNPAFAILDTLKFE